MAARARGMLTGFGLLLLSPLQFLFALTRAGWAFFAVIVLTAAVSVKFPANQIPFLVAMLLVALLLVSTVLPGLSLRRIVMRRTIPARIWAGQTARVELVIHNGKRMIPGAGVHIRESLRSAPGIPPIRVFAPILPARKTARIRYPLRVRRRGVYAFNATQLGTTFPLGLLTGRAECTIETELVVYPRLGTIDGELFDRTDRYFEARRRRRPCLIEEDFRGLREFRRGDNPKWIHWRSSARRGELLVREFEQPETRRLTVVLDTYLPADSDRREGNLEIAISFAGSLVRDALERGYEATFAGFVPEPAVIELSRERRNLDALYESLARLTPSRRTPAARIARALGPRLLGGAVVFVVTPGPVSISRPGAAEAPGEPFERHDNVVRVIDVTAPSFRRLFVRDPAEGFADEEAETALVVPAGDPQEGNAP